MSVLVVVVNGKPEAGKDSAIRFGIDYLRSMGVPGVTFSSIDPVKDMLSCAPLGINVREKTPELRLLLSKVGDALEEYNGLRTNECIRFILQRANLRDVSDLVAFIQIREPHLIQRLRDRATEKGWHFTTIFVDRPGHEVFADNPSDQGVHGARYDHRIVNDRTLGGLYDSMASCVAAAWGNAKMVAEPA